MLFVTTLQAAEAPVNYNWGFPLKGNWWDFIGFGFASWNSAFNGWHLAVDTRLDRTPVGTEVFAPCSGMVVISDNKNWGGYGSNNNQNSLYRGYVLVIECHDKYNNYQTALLGHLQPGSNQYDANQHVGLAPLNSIVYKGQYVGRVASYWNGAGFTSDWHHLHFGIRQGKFDPNNQSAYVAGYSSSGWSDNNSVHTSWKEPQNFTADHSMNTAWHPNGTLIQNYSWNEVYQLIDGAKHWIEDEQVFETHHFNWSRVIHVRENEFDCYDSDWPIDWQPWREIFLVGQQYYLFESSFKGSASGTFYPMASELVRASWDYLDSDVTVISLLELNLSLSNNKAMGNKLYLREGTVVYAGDKNNWSWNNLYLSLGQGNLAKFQSEEVFWKLGYDYDDIIFTSIAELNKSYVQINKIISLNDIQTCSGTGVVIAGGGQEDVNSESDVIQSYDVKEHFVDQKEVVEPIVDVFNNEQQEPELIIEIVEELTPETVVTVDVSQLNDSQEVNDVLDFNEVVDDIEANAPDVYSTLEAVEALPETKEGSGEALTLENEVDCTVICPFPYHAHIWYGEKWINGFERVRMDSTVEEICLRGAPWIDFNCALPDWKAFDFELAYIECNHPTWYGSGKVDYNGEGEIWFLDFSCQQ